MSEALLSDPGRRIKPGSYARKALTFVRGGGKLRTYPAMPRVCDRSVLEAILKERSTESWFYVDISELFLKWGRPTKEKDELADQEGIDLRTVYKVGHGVEPAIPFTTKDFQMSSFTIETATHLLIMVAENEVFRDKWVAGIDSAVQTTTNPLLPRNLIKMFFAAARDGDYSSVQDLLGDGADVYDTDKDGNTALHIAAAFDHMDVVTLLLAAGADPTAHNHRCDNPFLMAVRYGRIKTTNQLMGYEAQTVHGVRTALHVAAAAAQGYILDILVCTGYDAMALDHEKRTPMHYACGGEISFATHTSSMATGATTLELPPCPSQDEARKYVCAVLGQAQAECVDVPNIHGETPLHEAARVGNLIALQELLGFCCLVNVFNANHKTALDLANTYKHADCVRLLLQYDAKTGSEFLKEKRREAKTKGMISHSWNPGAGFDDSNAALWGDELEEGKKSAMLRKKQSFSDSLMKLSLGKTSLAAPNNAWVPLRRTQSEFSANPGQFAGGDQPASSKSRKRSHKSRQHGGLAPILEEAGDSQRHWSPNNPVRQGLMSGLGASNDESGADGGYYDPALYSSVDSTQWPQQYDVFPPEGQEGTGEGYVHPQFNYNDGYYGQEEQVPTGQPGVGVTPQKGKLSRSMSESNVQVKRVSFHPLGSPVPVPEEEGEAPPPPPPAGNAPETSKRPDGRPKVSLPKVGKSRRDVLQGAMRRRAADVIVGGGEKKEVVVANNTGLATILATAQHTDHAKMALHFQLAEDIASPSSDTVVVRSAPAEKDPSITSPSRSLSLPSSSRSRPVRPSSASTDPGQPVIPASTTPESVPTSDGHSGTESEDDGFVPFNKQTFADKKPPESAPAKKKPLSSADSLSRRISRAISKNKSRSLKVSTTASPVAKKTRKTPTARVDTPRAAPRSRRAVASTTPTTPNVNPVPESEEESSAEETSSSKPRMSSEAAPLPPSTPVAPVAPVRESAAKNPSPTSPPVSKVVRRQPKPSPTTTRPAKKPTPAPKTMAKKRMASSPSITPVRGRRSQPKPSVTRKAATPTGAVKTSSSSMRRTSSAQAVRKASSSSGPSSSGSFSSGTPGGGRRTAAPRLKKALSLSPAVPFDSPALGLKRSLVLKKPGDEVSAKVNSGSSVTFTVTVSRTVEEDVEEDQPA